MSKKTLIFIILTLFIFSASIHTEASSLKEQNIMIILDASGSMWAQVNNKAKIEIAREVLHDLIRDLPENINAGLTAYGHRTKGDCSDIEIIVPLQKLNRDLLKKNIKALSPKGKTPIVGALSRILKSLKNVKGRTTLILLSDGKETCHESPCSAVKELKNSGIKFIMHVIGFNVNADEEKELKCMALASEGSYFAAGDISSLKKAFQTISETVNISDLKGEIIPDKKIYKPGENIKLRFKADIGYASNAWIGIIPSEIEHGKEQIADRHELAYKYIRKKIKGDMNFKAPLKNGKYDLRMFNTDISGVETASVTFEVKGSLYQGTLKTDKNQYAPGEEIRVNFTAGSHFASSAWIGIVPSSIPHGKEKDSDGKYTEYKYIRKKLKGTMVFRAPAIKGKWSIRMFDNDSSGNETASLEFTVKGKILKPGLSCKVKSVKSGEEIKVSFTAPQTFSSNAWIGIVPSEIKHGKESLNDKHDLAYQYIKRRTSGTMTFKAPLKKGSYDFRMNDSDSNGKEVAHITFKVE